MTVRIYRSTDASAPTLTGQVGSLTSLLDAILVNGYGSQTAAGWTIGFTTTNKRAYQQNTTGANLPTGAFLYIDDTGPGAGGAREARACGFETMSAITPTGTGQFPTLAQTGIGVGTLVIRKSTTADSTARAWTCIADGHTVYLFVETGDITVPTATYAFSFGDFFSYRSGDQYAIVIMGRVAENVTSQSPEATCVLTGFNQPVVFNTSIGHYACRSWTGVGGSVQVGKHTDQTKMGQYAASNISSGTAFANNGPSVAIGRIQANPTAFPYPNGPDGACWLAPVWLHHNGSVRGYLKGFWAPLHDRPLNHNDTFTVSGGNLNGKSFVAQAVGTYVNSTNEIGQVHIETSDTWS
jgi:hypothetical protein